MYDVVSLRAHFPALAKGAAHFDGPGASQVTGVVAVTIRDTLTAWVSNRGSVTPAERCADAAMTLVQEHEDGLRRAVEDGLAALPGVRVHSGAGVRTPTPLLTFDGRDAWKAYEFLAMLDINAPAGSFYALEASRYLGLGDSGGLRVGLAPYSDQRDVDRLLAALAEFLAVPPDSAPVTT